MSWQDVPCKVFTGATVKGGYGRVAVGGRKGRKVLAHRLAWEREYGPIPEGMLVCHHCDNPPCWEPAHLFLGTHSDNALDREAKGRGVDNRGEAHPRTHLTLSKVTWMRKLYARSLYTLTELASLYGISHSAVQKIVYGVNWK